MKVELIAEVSTNHGGSVALAKEFIARFAEAGADWMKFQHTRVRHLRPTDPQYAWFQQAELSHDQFAELKAYTEACGVKFLTTVYHTADVPEVVALGVQAIKIGAGEWADSGLVQAAKTTRLRTIRSWPQGTPWTSAGGYVPTTDILSTVCRYPAPSWACLAAIEKISVQSVNGYSDHAVGPEMCQRAIDAGARIIEKHVYLPTQARQTRSFEASVAEFATLRHYADTGYEQFVGRWQ